MTQKPTVNKVDRIRRGKRVLRYLHHDDELLVLLATKQQQGKSTSSLSTTTSSRKTVGKLRRVPTSYRMKPTTQNSTFDTDEYLQKDGEERVEELKNNARRRMLSHGIQYLQLGSPSRSTNMVLAHNYQKHSDQNINDYVSSEQRSRPPLFRTNSIASSE